MSDVTAKLSVRFDVTGQERIAAATKQLEQANAAVRSQTRGRNPALQQAREQQRLARDELRNAKAVERQSRSQMSVEGEMAKLQRNRERAELRSQARKRLDPSAGGPSFWGGHGFGSSARQVVGGLRDLTVAGMGARFAIQGIGAAFASVLDPLRAFQTNMARAQAKGLSAETALRVGALAREMGRTTQYSAGEVSAASVELAAAGLTSESQQRSALPSVLRMAQAGELSGERAAALLVETGGQFGLGTDQFERMGDTIVKAANMSTISVEDLAESMKYAGPEARAAGMDLEHTAAAIALIGEKGGIKGSMAGTGLAGIISRLARPRKMGLTALSQLGLSKKDAQAGLQDMPAFFQRLNTGMNKRKLNDAQRLEFAGMIFGAEHAKTALTLMNAAVEDGGKAWKGFNEGVRNSKGTLQETADILGNTVDGQMKKLHASIEDTQITLAEQFLPDINRAVPKLRDMALATGQWTRENGAAIVSLTKIGGTLLGAGGAWKGLNLAGGVLGALPGTAAITAAGTTFGTTFAAAVVAAVIGYKIGEKILEWTKDPQTGTTASEDFGRWIYDLQNGTAVGRVQTRSADGKEWAAAQESVTIGRETAPNAPQFNAVTGQIEIKVTDERVKVRSLSNGPVRLRTGANPSAPNSSNWSIYENSGAQAPGGAL